MRNGLMVGGSYAKNQNIYRCAGDYRDYTKGILGVFLTSIFLAFLFVLLENLLMHS
jgi:hypothetical protein